MLRQIFGDILESYLLALQTRKQSQALLSKSCITESQQVLNRKKSRLKCKVAAHVSYNGSYHEV